jgi:hypothetical protein
MNRPSQLPKNEKIATLISPEPTHERIVSFPRSSSRRPKPPPRRKLAPYIFLGLMIGLAVVCAVVWLSPSERPKEPTPKIIIQPQPR